MKNNQRGFGIFVLLLILGVVALGGGAYVYTQYPNVLKNPDDISKIGTTTNTTQVHMSGNSQIQYPTPAAAKTYTISDSAIFKAVADPQAKILAKGDINGDGYEDAIVQKVSCGASCGVALMAVIRNTDGTTRALGAAFPLLVTSGAAKTEVKSVSIQNGIITITANGFKDIDWNVLTTKNFVFEGGKLVEPIGQASKQSTD